MNNTYVQTLVILIATAVLPMGLMAFDSINGGEPEGLKMLPLFLIAHCMVMLASIPAFRKAPYLSWVLWTLFYPLAVAVVISVLMSPLGNPGSAIGALWLMAFMVIGYWWISIPVGGVSATIVFILTRSDRATNRENPPPLPTD